MLWSALSLTLGYNATLVTLGATLLGIATGIAGTFLYLRKNALISDAISHATLPGLGAPSPGRVAWEIASLINAFLRRYRNVPAIPVAMPNSVAPSVTKVALYPSVRLRADHSIYDRARS